MSRRWRFVLCGSSARRLRKTGANLLPGRSFLPRLYPPVLAEHAPVPERVACAVCPLALSWPPGSVPSTLFPCADLRSRLAWGALPWFCLGTGKIGSATFLHFGCGLARLQGQQ